MTTAPAPANARTNSPAPSSVESQRYLRAARGEIVDRPPVWIMRQAGRYLPEYRALCTDYSFQQRCETPELAIEISLQPFRRFGPDGVIMFSDILTPLPGIGIPFKLVESIGPVINTPIRTQAQIDNIHPLESERELPFIKEILSGLRSEVGGKATVLGFVGAPWTLATYLVEGKGTEDYAIIKAMAYKEPDLLHQLLSKLADAIGLYASYQIDSGAQVIQLFDSWAGQLSPLDYQTFALPYEKRIVETIKREHPETPVVLYMKGSSGLLETVGASGVDVFGVDWMSDIGLAKKRLSHSGNITAVQGNLDPMVLMGNEESIRDRTLAIIH
ncbi:MAG: uroporphyrinogen decarboxylase, partial [Cyanobacteria bacterium J06635_11]